MLEKFYRLLQAPGIVLPFGPRVVGAEAVPTDTTSPAGSLALSINGTPYVRRSTGWEALQVGNSKLLDVRLYGAVGDGTTDSTTALQAALTAATSGSTVVIPPGTYLVSSSLTVPSGIRIEGRGAALKATATLGAFAPVLDLNGVTDVTISGLEVNGNKSAYATVTEQRHGIRVIGSSQRIALRDLYLHDNKGDGLYIGSGDGSTYVQRVDAENLRCDANHRQGMSITALKDAHFRDCWFTNTSGTAPQAGVDIEPNGASAVIENIVFSGGGAHNNTGTGFQFFYPTSSSVQYGVVLQGFMSRSNTSHGISIAQGKGIVIEGCLIYSNGDRGIVISDNCRGITISNNRIHTNGRQGIYALAQFNTKFLTGLLIANNRIHDNGTLSANTLDAIRLDWALGPASGASGVIVSGNHCGNQDTSNQRYAITTDGGANFVDLVLANNYLKGCATGVSVLLDDTATRRVRGNAGLADN